jgi:hypothetical protein
VERAQACPPIAARIRVDLSRFCASPGARLSDIPFECDGAFPAQC